MCFLCRCRFTNFIFLFMASCNPYAKQKNTLPIYYTTYLCRKIFVEYYVRNNYFKNVSINFDIFHGLEFFQIEGSCSHSEGIWEWKLTPLILTSTLGGSLMLQSFYLRWNNIFYLLHRKLSGLQNQIGHFEDELSTFLLQQVLHWPLGCPSAT